MISWALVLASPFRVPVVAFALFQHPVRPTPRAWLGFGYVAVVSMFLGFLPWYRALGIGGVARISQIQLAQPALTLLWSALLLGEHIDLITVVAGVLVLLSVGMSQRMRVRHIAASGETTNDHRTTGREPTVLGP